MPAFGAARDHKHLRRSVPVAEARATTAGEHEVACTMPGYCETHRDGSGGRGRRRAAVRIAPGPYPESAFYASSGTYSLDYTCNTWTATALKAAGLPIQASGVVLLIRSPAGCGPQGGSTMRLSCRLTNLP
jgi:hypothetical protein